MIKLFKDSSTEFVSGGLIGHEWCIDCESYKPSDEYLSTLEDATEDLNCKA
jgi:hypothetical protein